MTTDKRTAIIEKIKKLLALSTSSNEHEAAAAAEKARQLLEAYDLEAVDLQEQPESVHEHCHDQRYCTLPTWLSDLAYVAAEHFSCKYLIHKNHSGPGSIIAFIGTPTDTAIADYVFMFLQRTIDRIAANTPTPPGMNTRRFRDSFKIGAVHGIREKLQSIRAASQHRTENRVQTHAATGRDLVLIKRDAVEIYTRNKYPRIRKQSGSQARPDSSSYHAGAAAGRDISINPAVNQHAGAKAIA